MQPFIAAMSKVRQAFYAAILKSVLRTKSWLWTLLGFWTAPALIIDETIDHVDDSRKRQVTFLEGVRRELGREMLSDRLVALSNGLKRQMEESLLENPMCMLPSYNHQLPTGDECGTYLALDVGGSTFRVAMVGLSGRKSEGKECSILKSASIKIDGAVKQLQGVLFFDWMAEKIEEMLSGQAEGQELSETPLSMGLSWSFPIEQTSLRSGLLQGMGKGFMAAHGLLGQDLGDLIQGACSRRGLNVQLNAIVNDSSATLLSKAYLDPSTRFALILGTGFNAAVHLPVHIFSPSKLGTRPSSWHDSAKHVIVNTEMSMFGKDILPYTKWDKQLLAAHPHPDFQPLEHFVGGGYLGEIARLILVDGIQTTGLFGGVIPPNLRDKYSLDTETLSRIECDTSASLNIALQIFTSCHPSTYTPTATDLHALHQIASHVTQRAAGVVAAGVHALWSLRNDANTTSAFDQQHTIVAYNGSVVEHYPGFKETCQKHLDELAMASGAKSGVIELMYAEESSLLGAAVSVACLDG